MEKQNLEAVENNSLKEGVNSGKTMMRICLDEFLFGLNLDICNIKGEDGKDLKFLTVSFRNEPVAHYDANWIENIGPDGLRTIRVEVTNVPLTKDLFEKIILQK